MAAKTQPIYTVGHSNHTLADFVALIRQPGIEVLVDVRSVPRSAYSPHFDAASLKDAVEAAGVRYLPMGKELGGRPDSLEFYDEKGRVRYDRLAETRVFQTRLDRIEKGRQRYRLALMCSEDDPSGCHRRLLIARVLADRGVPVAHLFGSGAIRTEAELAAADRERAGGQLALFDVREVTEWRSIRSVLPVDRRPTSSEP